MLVMIVLAYVALQVNGMEFLKVEPEALRLLSAAAIVCKPCISTIERAGFGGLTS